MRITVVGDALLDVDVDGTSERLAPDAPVPVVDVERREDRAGGAGLAATLLARDGHEVELVTAIAEDAGGQRLRARLDGVRLVAAGSNAPTPVKTRIRANGHLIARIDEGGAGGLPQPGPEVLAAIAAAELLVVADYGRGMTAHPGVRAALERRGAAVPLVWDPHPRGADPVASADTVTPNLSEAARAAGLPAGGVPAAAEASRLLAERWGCRAVVVTLGAAGALLREPGAAAPLLLPAPSIAAADPCGAGDRFATSLAVALAEGLARAEAVGRAVEEATAFIAGGGVAGLRVPAVPSLAITTRRRALRADEDRRRETA